MSLVLLSSVKSNLGIADTSQDAKLTGLIRSAGAIIRNYLNKYIGGLIASNTLANPTVVTSIGHGLVTGDTIVIGGSNCTPTIDGSRVITRLSDDTFSVPVNVTVAGTAGYYAKTLTQFYCGTGQAVLILSENPVLSLTSVYLDNAAYFGDAAGAFASDTLLDLGVDFALDKPRGFLINLSGRWPNVNERVAHLLAAGVRDGIGNVKVTWTPGYAEGVPYDISQAASQLVCELLQSAESGGGMQSESLDYYSYSRASAAEQAAMLSSVKGMLANYSGGSVVL